MAHLLMAHFKTPPPPNRSRRTGVSTSVGVLRPQHSSTGPVLLQRVSTWSPLTSATSTLIFPNPHTAMKSGRSQRRAQSGATAASHKAQCAAPTGCGCHRHQLFMSMRVILFEINSR